LTAAAAVAALEVEEMSPMGAVADMRAARARVEKGGTTREQVARRTSRRRSTRAGSAGAEGAEAEEVGRRKVQELD
jgi:hypothetical protein